MVKKSSSKGGNVQRLDTGYFNTAISELSTAIKEFESSLSNINRQTEQLQSSWEGSGASKFDSAFKRLKKEFNDQSENLVAIREDLRTMLETYQNWDAELKIDISGNALKN